MHSVTVRRTAGPTGEEDDCRQLVCHYTEEDAVHVPTAVAYRLA